MSTRDAWLLHLYGEGDDERLPDPSEVPDEAASMGEMKALLEARPRTTPDPRVVSAVLAAARGESVPKVARCDRPPARRSRMTGLRVGAVSAVVVLLFGLVGLLQTDVIGPGSSPDRALTASKATDVPEAAPPADSGAAAAEGPRTPQGTVSSGGLRTLTDARTARVETTAPTRVPDRSVTNRMPAGGQASSELQALSWDERDDVIDLHQRIERIGSGVEGGWEAPAVPLEMMPARQDDPDGSGAGIIPAGQRR